MGKKLTITPPIDLTTDTSITRADFVNWFTNAVFGDVDRDHFATGTNPIVSSATEPSASATGLGWHDTTTGLVSFWNGSEWLSVVTIQSTAPSETGILWYDTTLELLRRYATIDSIAGWHPIDSAYQLMHNRSGGAVTAGDVVVRDTTGTSNREFKTTTLIKDQSVVGVVVEDGNDNAAVVVGTVAGGAVVDVLADDGEADGAIAKGDALATFSIAGECRTVGALASTAFNSASLRTSGTQAGAFAEALGTKDATTHMVRCRLLGYVGQGMRCVINPVTVVALINNTASTTSSWTEADISGQYPSSKHGPAVSASCEVALYITNTAGPSFRDIQIELSMDQTTAIRTFRMDGYYSTGTNYKNAFTVLAPVDDSTTTPTGIGDKFSVRSVTDAGNLGTISYFYLEEFVV